LAVIGPNVENKITLLKSREQSAVEGDLAVPMLDPGSLQQITVQIKDRRGLHPVVNAQLP
jgi:hypothetical protein